MSIRPFGSADDQSTEADLAAGATPRRRQTAPVQSRQTGQGPASQSLRHTTRLALRSGSPHGS